MKLSFWELPLRSIPEGIIFMLAIYTFSGAALNKKKWFLTGVLLGVITYIIRFLPINVGVHTFILVILLVIISVVINKIEIPKAISSALIATIILFVSEFINMGLLVKVIKVNSDVLKDPFLKIIYGLPSLFIFLILISVSYIWIKSKREGQKSASYRKAV